MTDLKIKIRKIRKIRKQQINFGVKIKVGTLKINANWSKEMIDDIKKLKSYDSVAEMEKKIVREMQGANDYYIKKHFNI